jgi:hypothetical protein
MTRRKPSSRMSRTGIVMALSMSAWPLEEKSSSLAGEVGGGS